MVDKELSKKFRNLPNYITFARLGLIPLFVALMIDPSRWMVNLAIVVFAIAVMTDYVDGFLARRYGVVTDFGKLLDPVADKILVMAALVMLVAQRSDLYGEPWVPGWIVVLVLARETWVTGIRAVAASRGIIVAANNTGKVKSSLQMISIILLLMHEYAFRLGGIQISCQIVGVNLLLISVAFSYWAAFEYTHQILFKEDKILTPERDDNVQVQ